MDNKNKDKNSNVQKERWDKRLVLFMRPIYQKSKTVFWVTFFIALFLIAYLFHRIFISIYPGEVGVLWKRFDGGVQQVVYGEGLHIVNPFNVMSIYDTRIQRISVEFTVLSSKGLTINVRAAARFHPHKEKIYELHQNIGPEYKERIVIPEVKGVLRRVIGNLTPGQLYSMADMKIQNYMLNHSDELTMVNIIFEDLIIEEISLPNAVKTVIEAKFQEEQRYEAYKFKILREEQEAKRKEIEATGIKRFQEIVNKSLTDNYLLYRGIDATLQLAQSDNAKIVIIGNKEGLPLILNTDSSASDNNTSMVNEFTEGQEYDDKTNMSTDKTKLIPDAGFSSSSSIKDKLSVGSNNQ
jgi:regulator of protease activity HflC (stomatin/prohibitin superfamily)